MSLIYMSLIYNSHKTSTQRAGEELLTTHVYNIQSLQNKHPESRGGASDHLCLQNTILKEEAHRELGGAGIWDIHHSWAMESGGIS